MVNVKEEKFARRFILFHGFLFLGFLLYFMRRYNGFDLELALFSGKSLFSGLSPYDFKVASPFRYAPWVPFLTAPFLQLPLSFCHWIFFLLSLVMLARMHWILIELYDREIGFKSSRQKEWALILPLLLLLRGLGAQIEGGNSNILLIYLSVEGLYQFFKRPEWGMFLMCFGLGIKPQFGLLPFLVCLIFRNRIRWKMLGVGVVLTALWCLPFSLGIEKAELWYREWFQIIRDSSLDNLLNRTGNGNLSLFSFVVHVWNWTQKQAYVFLLLPVVFSTAYLTWKKASPLLVLSAALWINYCFSPVSFAYSQVALIAPIFLGVAIAADKRSWIGILPVLALILGEWLLSFEIVGRTFYNQVVVNYRLQTWLCLPLAAYWRQIQFRP